MRNLRLLLRMDLLMCHLDTLPAGKLSVVSITMCSGNRIAGAERPLHHLALVVVGGKVLAGVSAGVQVKHLQIGNAGVSLTHARSQQSFRRWARHPSHVCLDTKCSSRLWQEGARGCSRVH